MRPRATYIFLILPHWCQSMAPAAECGPNFEWNSRVFQQLPTATSTIAQNFGKVIYPQRDVTKIIENSMFALSGLVGTAVA